MPRTISTLAIASLGAAAFSSAALAQDTARMVAQLESGQTMTYRSSDSSEVQSPMGEQTSATVSRIHFDVQDRNSNGQFVVDVDYPAMTVEQAAGPQSINYDTRKPDAGNPPPQLKTMFDALTAVDFTAFINENGEIEEVKGLTALTDASEGMFDAASDPSILTREYALVFTEGAGKTEVAVGETWTRSESSQVSQGVSIEMTLRATLDSIKDGVAHISIDGEASLQDASGAITLQNADITGSAKRDADTGRLLDHTLQTNFTLGADMQGQQMEFQIASESSLKLTSADGESVGS